MLPGLQEPLPKHARQASQRLAPLNLDDIIIEEEVVVAGPSNRPVGHDEDLGIALAYMHLAEPIHDLGCVTNTDEKDMVDAFEYRDPAGEKRSYSCRADRC